MLKVIITAPRGKMDRLIVQEAYKHSEIQVIGCVGHSGGGYRREDENAGESGRDERPELLVHDVSPASVGCLSVVWMPRGAQDE